MNSGQFSLTWDKRQLYETDIKVPMLMRGPGIKIKQLIQSPVLNIDIAPTLLNIAGIHIPDDMDGISMLPLTLTSANISRSRSFVIEYHGEGNAQSISEKCSCRDDNNLAVSLQMIDFKDNFLLNLFIYFISPILVYTILEK